MTVLYRRSVPSAMAGDGDLWFFDRIAPLYDRFMFGADRDALEAGLDRARRDVERVVDVAGGTGRAAAAIPREERLVVDASRPMLRRAARRGLGAVAGDAAALPLADGSVDAVMVVDAFHHLPDQAGAIREARRVLRPGGVLVVRDFDRSSFRGHAIETLEHLVRFRSRFRTADEVAEQLEAAGLTAAVPVGGWSYTVAGVKGAD